MSRLFSNKPIRPEVVRLLRRLPIVYDLLKSAQRLVFRLTQQRKLRRLGYLIGSEQSPVASSKLKIDIVIPSIEKDLKTLPHVIDFARANVLHPIGNIYVVSPDSEKIRQVCSEKGCIFVYEDTLLPIRKSDIDYRVGTLNLAGWMYQQFLKLSGDLFCSQENYLVLDSDTLLVKPQVFERDGKYIFNFSDEYHKPYFDVYERLLGYPAPCPVSLTSHHILVNVHKLRQLKADLEARNGLAWYDAIMNAIDKSEPSGHSDYDTYGQYVLRSMKDSVYLEYWHNLSLSPQLISNVNELSAKYAKKFKSLSFHSYNSGKST